MRENEKELHTLHGSETIKKIYDLFFLVQICRKSKGGIEEGICC